MTIKKCKGCEHPICKFDGRWFHARQEDEYGDYWQLRTWSCNYKLGEKICKCDKIDEVLCDCMQPEP